MISEEQLQEWERLANNATEGPWSLCEGDLCRNECPFAQPENCPYQCEECLITSEDDKIFIVNARTSVPALIAEVRKLQDWKKILTRYRAWAIGYITRLEKEVAWLADIADYYCGQDYKFCMRRCPLKSKDFRTGDIWCSTETSPELWREAARRAVSHDQD